MRMEANPSAVIELEYQAVDSSQWQRELERAVAVLRLFGLGGVRWSRVEAGSDSFLDFRGPTACFDTGGGKPRTYAVNPVDTARLPHFWRTVAQALPEYFYWRSPEDLEGLNRAYFNFCAVVARFGFADEKVASVVRSLESLFLSGKSKDISAKLRSRASALLRACGFDGTEVHDTLHLAYEVRSRFVHGDQPAARTNAEIRRRVGDVSTLFHRCLEYNRAALVASIVSGLEKDELIEALDSPAKLQRIGDAFRDAEGYGRPPRRKRRRT